MAKAKRGARRITGRSKRVSRRAVRRAISKKVPMKPVFVKNKRRTAFKNLILFALISLVCWILYTVSVPNSIFWNLFWLLSIISLFVALAFFIVWLVLVLLKAMRR